MNRSMASVIEQHALGSLRRTGQVGECQPQRMAVIAFKLIKRFAD
jgi:hypothetical protein